MTHGRSGWVLLLATALACAHTPSVVTDGDRFDLGARRYPQLVDRGDTLLPPRSALTPCSDSTLPGWQPGLLTWPSPRIPPLDVRLPPSFEGVDLAPAAKMARQSGFNANGWTHAIGQWGTAPATEPDGGFHPAMVRLSADSSPGFPTAVEQGKSRQLSIEECLVGTPVLPGRMVIVTVQSDRRLIEFFGFWRVDEHSWIKANGMAWTAIDSASIRGAMAGLRLK